MEESARGEQIDRLSELPDSIILRILSLLPLRNVISTTFLSRRWNNLWTSVPCLNFTCMEDDEDNIYIYDERVRNLVNRALLFWNGSKILKFKLFIDRDFVHVKLASDVDLWLRFAVDNNVEELSLNLTYSSDPEEIEWEDFVKCIYMVPQCLYSCSSITDLTLVGCNLRIHESPIWNQLKTLTMDGFCFSEDSISRVMLGCPLLENFWLTLMEGNEDLNIQSTSLKMLRIHRYLDDGQQPSLDTKMRIWCPNLKMLELIGVMYSNYRLENVSSLTDADLSFSSKRAYMLTALRGLVSALENVENVTLSGWCVKVLSRSKYLRKPLPNVKFIKLYVLAIEHERLVNLLLNFPNLKMLVIHVERAPPGWKFIDKPLEPKEGLSTSSFPQLTVEVRACIDNEKTFQSIVFLLYHFRMLQKFVIRAYDVQRCPPEFMLKVAGELLSLQRSYPATQVILNKYC